MISILNSRNLLCFITLTAILFFFIFFVVMETGESTRLLRQTVELFSGLHFIRGVECVVNCFV